MGKPRRARKGANSFTLTRAQREVAECVGKCLDPEHIAEELGVEVTTVQTHITRIASKIPKMGFLRGHKKVLAWVLSKVVSEKKEAAWQRLTRL